jgi:hypothetical protein
MRVVRKDPCGAPPGDSRRSPCDPYFTTVEHGPQRSLDVPHGRANLLRQLIRGAFTAIAQQRGDVAR